MLRLVLSAVYFAHGAQKLFGVFGGAGLEGTASGFAAIGLKPAFFLALVAGLIEFFGALFLFIGLFARPVALALAFEMLFALIAVHAPNGFFLNWSCAPGRGHGIEYSLVLVGSLASLAMIGAGRISVDGSRAVRRKLGMVPVQRTPPEF